MATGIEDVPTKYSVAHNVLGLLGLFGWLLFGAGALLMGYALTQMIGTDDYGNSKFSITALVSLGPSVGLIFGGLFTLTNVQLTRAAIDTADISREMLRIMRSQE
jgi:hypothetical protein